MPNLLICGAVCIRFLYLFFDSYSLKNASNTSFKYFKVSDINYDNKEEHKRTVSINTKKFGVVAVTASRLPYRKNHRNNFSLNIEKSELLTLDNCSGCMMNIHTLHEIQSLRYIDKDNTCCLKSNVSKSNKNSDLYIKQISE